MKSIPKLVGIGEYALIIGLNFGSFPKDVPHSTRLVSTHLNNNNIVKSHELEAVFIGCTDKDDV